MGRSPRQGYLGVLREIHDGASGGHLGVTRTLAKLRAFLLGERHKDVKEWCRKCVECEASNGPQRRKKGTDEAVQCGKPI
ncbi:hypothetical protein NQ317_004590 [Molorchus minor]|uniref:Integrase zinc-binding domain-containing protein n=1 Tax=Molorchus minor TaxID=1323400 RepID=A0ABQ9JY92_9CUCU|nr:hypothetical protein NQ317_004590 [Molorchus minor]